MTATAPWPAWQSIESAPRDGREFLIWDRFYGIRIGRCFVRPDHDDWLSWKNDHGGTSKGGIRATHWLPLPPAPEQGGGDG